ncbi:MAG: VRR-NUC domain-containing protein [Pararobbsia sp.]
MQRNEEVEQAKVVRWSHRRPVRDLFPGLARLHHSPNGGKRNGLTGAQMTALGTKKGFPDLVLPVAARGKIGLVIEMKFGSGKLTTEQVEWLGHFELQGWQTDTCFNAEEARRTICLYFGFPPDDAPGLDA